MLNGGWVYRDRVDRTAAGKTLLDYYSENYRHSTIGEWRERILSGQVLIDGLRANPDDRLKYGQKLTYHRPPWREPDVPLDFEVIHEDRAILVINKPSGLPVLVGGGFLEHTLIERVKKRYPADTPVPIHRLGRGTSGLILLARSNPARAALTRQMREGKITKIYRTLVTGRVKEDRSRIDRPIGRIPHPILGEVYGAVEEGLNAISDCRVLKRYPGSTLLEVEIHTGRPHQIRIHLASIGHPLVGDPLYESGGVPRIDRVPGDCGYHLHAYRIGFEHPETGTRVEFTCKPPEILEPNAQGPEKTADSIS